MSLCALPALCPFTLTWNWLISPSLYLHSFLFSLKWVTIKVLLGHWIQPPSVQAACKVIQVLLPLPLKIGELLQARLTTQSQLFQVREKQSSRKKNAFQKCVVSALSLMCYLFCLFVYFNAGALAQPEMLILIVQLCKKQDLPKLRSFRHCRNRQPACHGPVSQTSGYLKPKLQNPVSFLHGLQVLEVFCSALCVPLQGLFLFRDLKNVSEIWCLIQNYWKLSCNLIFLTSWLVGLRVLGLGCFEGMY